MATSKKAVPAHVTARHHFVEAGTSNYGAKREYAAALDARFPFAWSLVAFNKNAETNGVSQEEFNEVRGEYDAAKAEWESAGGNPDHFKKEWGQMKDHSQHKQVKKDAKAQVTTREKLLGHLRKAYNLASDPEAGASPDTLDALTTALLAEGINLEEA